MKKIGLALAFVCSLSMLFSCGSSPYKKRKNCKGNGSWYGKRNLGHLDYLQKLEKEKDTYYVQTQKKIKSINL